MSGVYFLICAILVLVEAGKDTLIGHQISTPAAPCIKPGLSCDGCNYIRMCYPDPLREFRAVPIMKCPKERPYCQESTASCGVKSDDDKCGKPDEFTCLKQYGYFPDPSDPKFYHFCSDYEAAKYSCLGIFDSSAQACMEKKSTDKIGFKDCDSEHDGKKVPYLSDLRFFGFCENGTVKFVDRCVPGHNFNEEKQICLPHCIKNSKTVNITNPNNCLTYYSCKNNKYELLECPVHEVYSLNDHKCKPSYSLQPNPCHYA